MKAATVSSETKPDTTAKLEAIGDLHDRLIAVDLKGRGAVDILYRVGPAEDTFKKYPNWPL